MKHRLWIVFLFSLVVCVACQHSGKEDMRLRLDYVSRCNRADTVFTEAWLPRVDSLVNYFDRHGSANEKMLAYYLLGRACQDIHDYPKALNSFQKAAGHADTTGVDSDCDYALLSRVYGQTSVVFYHQNLMEEDLHYINLAVRYAWKAKDTLAAIMSMTGKIGVYKRMGKPDSVLAICEQASALAKKYGYKNLSANILGGAISILVEKDSMDKAKTFMDIYESESGFFDKNNNIEKGREIYYYPKGQYYMAIGKYDSAEFYFRKELQEGRDFNNQNAGSRGLALLFQQTHRPDSAAKYALYSYAMNDSVYAHMATQEVERMKAMYDFTYHKNLAEQKENEAYRNKNAAIFFGMLLLLCLLAVYIIVMHIKRYKRGVNERERLLHTRLSELEHQLTIKEMMDVEKEMMDSPLVNSFHEMAKSSVKKPTLDEWSQLRSFLRDKLPAFWDKLHECEPPLRIEEVDVCLLIRLQFKAKDIANLTGMSLQSISNIRRRLLQRVFHQSEGGSKEFDRLIMKL